MIIEGVPLQVGIADIEEGSTAGLDRVCLAPAQDEPVGLGPASKCLAQMQNLRKVWLTSRQYQVCSSCMVLQVHHRIYQEVITLWPT